MSAAPSDMGCAMPVVVCDMGTSATRLGWAGNAAPTCVLPTFCAWRSPLTFESLYVGEEAHQMRQHPSITHRSAVLESGVVTNWDLYEEYWRHLFNQRLCIESSDVGVVVAEPARTPPRQRETVAEILFESYGVRRLYVGSQALFALSSSSRDGVGDTAVVVQSGAGVTEVVPVVDGYALTSSARRYPFAGRDVTQWILESLRSHSSSSSDGGGGGGGGIAETERAWEVTEGVKAAYAYVPTDFDSEWAKADADPAAFAIRHGEVHSRTRQRYEVVVGRERFTAPECFFDPSRMGEGTHPSLPDLIDSVVRSCPVDCRRALYRNIVLCGGNTAFPGLADRLGAELQSRLDRRAAQSAAVSRGALAAAPPPSSLSSALSSTPYEVHVVSRGPRDEDAVWRGGSRFGASGRFAAEATTRAEYEERGCLRRGG